MSQQFPYATNRRPAACRRRSPVAARSSRFLVLIVAYGLASPVLATQPCLAAPPGNVAIVNQTGANIWVGFSGSTITWGSGCTTTGSATTAEIPAATTCQATVPSTNAASRFCASPTSGTLNCANAQQNHQTLIETNFQPSCFSTSNSCIWYDISLIPLNPVPSGSGYCTDCTWNGNKNDPTCTPPPKNANSYCAGTGNIAYNLPASLSCSGEPKYKCQGPLSTKGPGGITYGEPYPSNCGNPNATCACGSPNCPAFPACVAAYFYPMFYPPENAHQPSAVCPNGQTLTITFLSGP
jgi:hypothetical protein